MVSASAVLRRCVYLDQGTDLPSTPLPVGASRGACDGADAAVALPSDRSSCGWLVAGHPRAASAAVRVPRGVYDRRFAGVKQVSRVDLGGRAVVIGMISGIGGIVSLRAGEPEQMQVNRGLVFWGVALITAGAVALAIQARLIPAESARQAWRLWPLVLVVIGLASSPRGRRSALVATLLAGLVAGGLAGTLVAGVPGRARASAAAASRPRSVDRGGHASRPTAEVELDFNCGELDGLDGRPAPRGAWRPDTAATRSPQISSDADSLRVERRGRRIHRLHRQPPGMGRRPADRCDPRPDGRRRTPRRRSWTSTDADLSSLAIDANAGEVNLGLAGRRGRRPRHRRQRRLGLDRGRRRRRASPARSR